jgi:hypothetical protein
MKNIVCTLIILTGLYSTIFAQQWVHTDVSNNIKITYDYSQTTQSTDTSLLLGLQIRDLSTNTIYNYGTISLSTSNVRDSLQLNPMIKQKYVNILDSIGKPLIDSHLRHFNIMIANIRDTIGRNKNSYVYQGLFMFQSAMNGVNRDPSGSGNIKFSVSGTYILQITSFVVQEDQIINVGDFIDYLNARKVWDTANLGIDYYLGALANTNEDNLNAVQITQLLTNYFAQTQSNGKFPQGNQCGCCGNYVGNCAFWSHWCLLHDRACQSCAYIWCGPQCQPIPCSQTGSVSWYWFVLAPTP